MNEHTITTAPPVPTPEPPSVPSENVEWHMAAALIAALAIIVFLAIFTKRKYGRPPYPRGTKANGAAAASPWHTVE